MRRRLLRPITALTRRPEVIGGLVGLLGFQRYQYFSIVKPTNVNAFIAGDWGTHMMGWLQYRHSPLWHLPLGQVPRLGYPLGTSMIYTDSIPIIGVLLRPFSFILPTDFQYLGIWLLASFVLQGALGARIVSIYFRSRLTVAAGAALFVVTPAFLIRSIHPALTAQWTILVLLYAALRGARKTRPGIVALVSITALIQPYLWLFVFVLLLGLLLDDMRRGAATRRGVLFAAAAALALSVGLLALVGAFSSGYESSTGGFGAGQANLLTLIADNGMSRNLKIASLPVTQYDGLGFLGLGTMLLLTFAVMLAIPKLRLRGSRDKLSASQWPMFTTLTALLLFTYALSDNVFLGHHKVLDLHWLYHFVLPLAERFRSSGRAIWPLMYLLLAIGLALLRTALGRWVKHPEPVAMAIVLMCATVQYFDLIMPNRYDAARSYFFSVGQQYHVDRLDDPRWSLISDRDYKHMSVIPTALYGCNGGLAEEGYYSGRVALLSLEAYRANLTFNSGYFARQRANVGESCAAQNTGTANHLDRDTIYVLTGDTAAPSDASCDVLNQIRVCVSTTNRDRFARALGT